MPAIIDSAPGCIHSVSGAVKGDDADFILQSTYAKCQGFMTFGPGSTYGDGGHSAATMYYIVTAVGIAVTVIVLVAWVLVERRRLLSHAIRLTSRSPDARGSA
jgi:hypothetical protein